MPFRRQEIEDERVMSLQLWNSANSKRKVRRLMDSHKWWLILEPEHRGFMAKVEDRFYGSGRAAWDYIMILWFSSNSGLLALHLCKKSRMTAEDLSALLRELGVDIPAETFQQRDVLGVGDDEMVQAAFRIVDSWLYGESKTRRSEEEKR